MGLFTKAKIVTGADALAQGQHNGELEEGTNVGWVSYCQADIREIAKMIGWQGGEGYSVPFLVSVDLDADGPRGVGYKVTAMGKTLGYTSRAAGPHTQTGKRVARLHGGLTGIAVLLLNP
jgi:hypothetical protein